MNCHIIETKTDKKKKKKKALSFLHSLSIMEHWLQCGLKKRLNLTLWINHNLTKDCKSNLILTHITQHFSFGQIIPD